MKFKSLFALSSSIAIPRLAAAHDVTVAEIESTRIKTSNDLGYLHRRLPCIAGTFVPLKGREPLTQSLEQLKDRVTSASHLAKKSRDEIVGEIDKTIRAIGEQPESMPKTVEQNGHDTGAAHDKTQGAGDQPRSQR